ncbi:MAG: acetolactate synthase [Clostridiales bacterium]|jgi:hypothetical protein|nr:hypothetical protein [Clostridia bacterium]MBR5365441.1 hypothetical protein [Clostridia bacterium]MCR5682393.1 acetolactate synthase [Clostridiales bacterium]
MSVKQLSVFAENKNGSIYEISKTLSDNNINIRAFSIADTQNYGILRLIVDDPRAAALALSSEGRIVSVTDVVGVQIPDERGGLTSLLAVLAEAEISVEYLYAFVASRVDDHAYVVLRVEDNAKTEELLVAAGFALCTDELLKQA